MVIWEGSTWQTCPFLLKCLAPVICSAWQWRITTQRIDLVHGCCSSAEVLQHCDVAAITARRPPHRYSKPSTLWASLVHV